MTKKAFPVINERHSDEGMDLRDYFAAKAMESIITRLGGNRPFCSSNEQDTFDRVAEESYKYAEALVKERRRLINNEKYT